MTESPHMHAFSSPKTTKQSDQYSDTRVTTKDSTSVQHDSFSLSSPLLSADDRTHSDLELAKPQTSSSVGRFFLSRPVENSQRMAHLVRANILWRQTTEAGICSKLAELHCRELVKHCLDNSIAIKEVIALRHEDKTSTPLTDLFMQHKSSVRVLFEHLPYGTYENERIICSKNEPRPPLSVKQRYIGQNRCGWGIQIVKYKSGFEYELFEGMFERTANQRPIRSGPGTLISKKDASRPGQIRVLNAPFVDDLAKGNGVEEVFHESKNGKKLLFRYEGNFLQGAFANNGMIMFSNGDYVQSFCFSGSRFARGTYTHASGFMSEATCVQRNNGDIGTLRLTHVNTPLGDEANYEGSAIVAWGTPQAATASTILPDGPGQLRRANGECFSGVFSQGMYARGVQTLSNGFKREGAFVNGKLSGLATEILPNGEKFEGKFVLGIRQGEFLRTPFGEKHPVDGQVYVDSQPKGEVYNLCSAYRNLRFGCANDGM